eukprot:GHUV01055495.1.p1 GENE.GHUV01055495.1~~GHUV01055495.1.p1  ORF type:complete len:182 (+),score=23.30 GHUV01055495.1:754-1299(+)
MYNLHWLYQRIHSRAGVEFSTYYCTVVMSEALFTMQGDLAPNDRLPQSVVRLFEGQIVGAESVAVGPRGQLVMLDRYNHLYEAWPDTAAPGGYKLNTQPLAKLGAGRPLGYHFDHEGNLIVCDSLKVSQSVTGTVRRGHLSATGSRSCICLGTVIITRVQPRSLRKQLDVSVALDGLGCKQ